MEMAGEALGMLETRGLVAAIEACDAMLKAARVQLLRRQVTSPALVTICVSGETAAVRSALEAGCRAAERVGLVLSSHLIPRPAEGILEMSSDLHREAWSSPAEQPEHVSAKKRELKDMPVRELRALARGLADFPLSGRQISLARRDELLGLLQEFLSS